MFWVFLVVVENRNAESSVERTVHTVGLEWHRFDGVTGNGARFEHLVESTKGVYATGQLWPI